MQSEDNPGAARSANELLPVVAAGASAGGLEAFEELLRALPADTGMAFVLIQHLDPSHESMLPHLLGRATAMPLTQVENGTVLSPNHVYVIPPNASMTIAGGVLSLEARGIGGTGIDSFLRSLAANHAGGVTAVILSGTGSDGSLGVQAIAEVGGVVFAQDPATAKFDGMPRSAIATGCVDFVMAPDGIAAELARIAHEPRLVRPQSVDAAGPRAEEEAEVQSIFELLRSATGIDFNLYRQTTVRRRVMRRVALLRLTNLGDYVRYLRENPDELHALTQDILIRVTRFFRDPETFEVLGRRVFPSLIRRTPPDGTVRIWTPGCSTGEEAYSLAMGFLEVAEQMHSRVPLQIFATDINEAAIERARRGAYTENIAADVSPERLARFFVRVGREFHVSRQLRNLCIFSRHDLLNDPPFSRMGMVSCRNVLIYLDSMQEHAFARFHFALEPGGFLLLGRSEAATSLPELFTPLDKDARLYVRQECSRSATPSLFARGKKAAPRLPRPLTAPVSLPPSRADLLRRADQVVLERFGPVRVIVDANLESFAPYGDTRAEAENQRLLAAVKESQSQALATAVWTAGRTGQSVRMEAVQIGEGARIRQVSVEVTPLGADRQHFLVVFEEGGAGSTAAGGETRDLEARIRRLEKELAANRAHSETVIVEQEVASEEVVASNEELQSLNEELESSKEELEATNEELTTLNQELEVRNAELENAREFAQATIDTVRGSLVVLGPDLRVSRANQSFYRAFQLSQAEVEQKYFYELGDGRWGSQRLRSLLEEILPARRSLEDFEIVQELPALGRRTLLLNAYRFEREERILLAIEDVTDSRHAEEESRQAHKMEAIGYLAAGVAHDFNNLLTGILGNASLLLDGLAPDDPRRERAESVLRGGQRAADLTRQLLAYAGKGRIYLERVDLSEVVMQTGSLIHPSIPAQVQLRLDLDRNLPLLLADPGQVQQVVMNLVINAAEAIGEAGGVVLVRTRRQRVNREGAAPAGRLAVGEYVVLEVQDNGSGMDEPTMEKIFDPFFTTKFTGRGLGLAAVQGIVRQHRGTVQVESAPGRGSAFRVFFPVGLQTAPDGGQRSLEGDLAGTGTVLVIDDEEMIRNFTRSALESYGYKVLLASDGAEGIRLLGENPAGIGLVLLDVAMAELDGLETLERMRAVRPDVRVLVCSGLGDADVEMRFAGKAVAGFFPKPYTVRELCRKVKECMAAGG